MEPEAVTENVAVPPVATVLFSGWASIPAVLQMPLGVTSAQLVPMRNSSSQKVPPGFWPLAALRSVKWNEFNAVGSATALSDTLNVAGSGGLPAPSEPGSTQRSTT